jgi:hypothetical protein
MELEKKSRAELLSLCKEKFLRGYSGKNKSGLIQLLQSSQQDTGKFRENDRDQFYTAPTVAKSCVQAICETVLNYMDFLWVEPAAGTGSFLNEVPVGVKKIGIDIDPKAKGIKQADFLTWDPLKADRTLIFGNPPFGRQSSTAKAFIKRSCEFADVVAFILPKSFEKPSMFSAFPPNFHLVKSIPLDRDSFILNGVKYDVPCVFQMWKKSSELRTIPEKISPKGFFYVKKHCEYNIACRRVGGLAGKCYLPNSSDFSIQSHYFIKLIHGWKAASVVEKMNAHVFPSNTVGPRSLSKSEINIVLNKIIADA